MLQGQTKRTKHIAGMLCRILNLLSGGGSFTKLRLITVCLEDALAVFSHL